MNAGRTNEATLLQRGLFLAGEYDVSGKTVDEILALKDAHERALLMLGRLGELVGEAAGGDSGVAVSMGPVIAVAEDLP